MDDKSLLVCPNLKTCKYKVHKKAWSPISIYGPRREKTCLWGFTNNTGADQPAHPHSLISAFVIRLLESIISRLATGEISTFKLVSVAEETDLKLALLETPKTGFVATRPICKIVILNKSCFNPLYTGNSLMGPDGFFSHQRISQRTVRASLEKQVDLRGLIAS